MGVARILIREGGSDNHFESLGHQKNFDGQKKNLQIDFQTPFHLVETILRGRL